MKLDARLETAPQESSNRVERDTRVTVDRDLMQLVERCVHDARDDSLDHHLAADQPPHQIADRGQLAERYERTVVVKAESRQGLSRKTRPHRFDQHRRLLMRRLRARRHQQAFVSRLDPRARGTIAERKNVGVARCLQRRLHDQLIVAIDFEPIQIGEPRRCFDSRCPNDEIGGKELAACSTHTLLDNFGDRFAGAHVDAQTFEQLGCRFGDLVRELRQDARRRFEQCQADIVGRVEMIQSVACMRPRRLADFRGQLDARRTGSDDHDIDSRRLARAAARVRADAHGQQQPMEALGINGGVECDRMLRYAGNTKVVAHAADAEEQRVVGQSARG